MALLAIADKPDSAEGPPIEFSENHVEPHVPYEFPIYRRRPPFACIPTNKTSSFNCRFHFHYAGHSWSPNGEIYHPPSRYECFCAILIISLSCRLHPAQREASRRTSRTTQETFSDLLLNCLRHLSRHDTS